MNRRDKTNYYLDMAQVALERGTCLRRNFGAVIVKNDVIVSTGYTGAPRGRANCIDIGTCVEQRTATGGPAPSAVAAQIEELTARLSALDDAAPFQ